MFCMVFAYGKLKSAVENIIGLMVDDLRVDHNLTIEKFDVLCKYGHMNDIGEI